MSLLLPGSVGISAMAIVAGYSVLLVYRSLPTVGLCTYETAAQKLGMASDAGIPCFIFIRTIRGRGKQECAAREKGANKNLVNL